MGYSFTQSSSICRGRGREVYVRTPTLKKNCTLIFKKQIFSFNVCVTSNTSVQFFKMFQVPRGIFQQKYMYSESVLNSSYVYDEIETSKEVLAGLKMMLTFLSRATSPPSFTYFK